MNRMRRYGAADYMSGAPNRIRYITITFRDDSGTTITLQSVDSLGILAADTHLEIFEVGGLGVITRVRFRGHRTEIRHVLIAYENYRAPDAIDWLRQE